MIRPSIPAALLLAIASLPAVAGSLYKPGQFQPLTSDLRARRVGDLITVLVYESASASSTADTRARREASVAVDVQGTGKSWAAGIGASNESDGGGLTQRQGKVLAQITVAIKEITPSGDLVLAGEQTLEINDERQQIVVEGTVRPQDVSETNVVLSTRIGNARIRYTGEGDLSDRQRAAWWQRLLTLFGA